jgi:hypothetical protein
LNCRVARPLGLLCDDRRVGHVIEVRMADEEGRGFLYVARGHPNRVAPGQTVVVAVEQENIVTIYELVVRVSEPPYDNRFTVFRHWSTCRCRREHLASRIFLHRLLRVLCGRRRRRD